MISEKVSPYPLIIIEMQSIFGFHATLAMSHTPSRRLPETGYRFLQEIVTWPALRVWSERKYPHTPDNYLQSIFGFPAMLAMSQSLAEIYTLFQGASWKECMTWPAWHENQN